VAEQKMSTNVELFFRGKSVPTHAEIMKTAAPLEILLINYDTIVE